MYSKFTYQKKKKKKDEREVECNGFEDKTFGTA